MILRIVIISLLCSSAISYCMLKSPSSHSKIVIEKGKQKLKAAVINPQAITAENALQLDTYLKTPNPKLSAHAINTLPEEMREIAIVMDHEEQLGSARLRLLLLCGGQYFGKETFLAGLAHYHKKKLLIFPSRELIKIFNDQTYKVLHTLIEGISKSEEKQIVVFKDLDELDHAYRTQWKSKFTENPTALLWQAMNNAGRYNPFLFMVGTATTSKNLSIRVGFAEKNIDLKILATKDLTKTPSGLHYIIRAKRVLQAFCFHIQQHGYGIRQEEIAPLIKQLCRHSNAVKGLEHWANQLVQKSLARNPAERLLSEGDFAALIEECRIQHEAQESPATDWTQHLKDVGEVIVATPTLLVDPWIALYRLLFVKNEPDITEDEIKNTLETEYDRLMEPLKQNSLQ